VLFFAVPAPKQESKSKSDCAIAVYRAAYKRMGFAYGGLGAAFVFLLVFVCGATTVARTVTAQLAHFACR
jgi:t-SNARE complex subunit (syntaxin)